MDNERDGPKFKAGDRVERKRGGTATVIEVGSGRCGLTGKPYPNHIRHDESEIETWWPDDELTLIEPAAKEAEPVAQQAYSWIITTEPVAQEEIMQAYQGLVWTTDAEGNFGEIVEQYGWTAYGSKADAEMEFWADFKAIHPDAELKFHRVVAVPFGG